jgi:hypothetical protein
MPVKQNTPKRKTATKSRAKTISQADIDTTLAPKTITVKNKPKAAKPKSATAKKPSKATSKARATTKTTKKQQIAPEAHTSPQTAKTNSKEERSKRAKEAAQKAKQAKINAMVEEVEATAPEHIKIENPNKPKRKIKYPYKAPEAPEGAILPSQLPENAKVIPAPQQSNAEILNFKPRRGVQSSFRKEYIRQAKILSDTGFTEIQVANFFNVNEITILDWKAKYPDFARALKLGKELPDDEIERSLYHRAKGYERTVIKPFMPSGAKEPIYAEFKEQVPPDTTACIFWLKNRRKEEWRDRQELTGADGAPLVASTSDVAMALLDLFKGAGVLDRGEAVAIEDKTAAA